MRGLEYKVLYIQRRRIRCLGWVCVLEEEVEVGKDGGGGGRGGINGWIILRTKYDM